MPFIDTILKYLPLIQTGASIAGNIWAGNKQQGAIEQAGVINQQATNDAMRLIMGLYDEGQSKLSPYSNVGPAALNRLQQIAYKGNIPAPAKIPTQTSGNAMSRLLPAPTSSMFGGGAPNIENAMATNPSGAAASSSLKKGLIGTGAGLGAAAGIGAGLGGMTALGALGGPIGMGLGAVGGLIASQFGKNNPYKAAASKGIDEVSRNIWGTNTPGIPPEQLTSGYVADAIQGRISPADAKAKIQADLDAWVRGMRANGTPEHLVQSSIATQKGYLAPLRPIFERLESQTPAA